LLLWFESNGSHRHRRVTHSSWAAPNSSRGSRKRDPVNVAALRAGKTEDPAAR
jgi:hypothetical protein